MEKVYVVKPYINLTALVLGSGNDECNVYSPNHSVSMTEHSSTTTTHDDAWLEHDDL